MLLKILWKFKCIIVNLMRNWKLIELIHDGYIFLINKNFIKKSVKRP
jgi:hypothetical protein